MSNSGGSHVEYEWSVWGKILTTLFPLQGDQGCRENRGWGPPVLVEMIPRINEHHWASETSQDAWIWRSFLAPQICMNWHFWQIRLDSKKVRFYHHLSNSPFHMCLNKVENMKSRQHSACILAVSCNLSYRYVSLPIGSMYDMFAYIQLIFMVFM